MKTRSILKFAAGLLAAVSISAGVQAHTTSVGSFNAGSPGSVTLVMGTYSHGSPIFQGAISLIAGPGITTPIMQSFTAVLNVKPAGLIDGVNNFYIDESSPSSDAFTSAVNTTGLPVTDWQAATFTGLTAGTYTYQLSGMTAVNWQNWNTSAFNWTGTLEITGESVNGVPDSGSTLALFGLGVLGLVGARRFRRAA